MKQVIELILSHSKALLQKISVQVAESSHDETLLQSEKSLREERRREARSPRISPCTYGLTRSVGRDAAAIEKGHGTAVNDSPTGMRLLLGVAPPKGQLLEIQTNHSTNGRTICLLEVCWTKPLQEGPEETLYLVGCRQSFDATHDKVV